MQPQPVDLSGTEVVTLFLQTKQVELVPVRYARPLEPAALNPNKDAAKYGLVGIQYRLAATCIGSSLRDELIQREFKLVTLFYGIEEHDEKSETQGGFIVLADFSRKKGDIKHRFPSLALHELLNATADTVHVFADQHDRRCTLMARGLDVERTPQTEIYVSEGLLMNRVLSSSATHREQAEAP